MAQAYRHVAGKRLVYGSFVAALSLAVLVLTIGGIDADNLRRALRLTARFSFLPFWCAYAGGSLAVLFGDRFRPLAQQGRNFGLAFASAHSIHLLLVVWLYRLSPEPPISMQSAVFFSIGVLWMYLLALLSIERLSRTLGPRLWRKLRLVGFPPSCPARQRQTPAALCTFCHTGRRRHGIPHSRLARKPQRSSASYANPQID
jgi:hypothetical protein